VQTRDFGLWPRPGSVRPGGQVAKWPTGQERTSGQVSAIWQPIKMAKSLRGRVWVCVIISPLSPTFPAVKTKKKESHIPVCPACPGQLWGRGDKSAGQLAKVL